MCRTQNSLGFIILLLKLEKLMSSSSCSHFGDIFDENFFIQSLEKHVHVVRELPADILQQFDNNISNIVNLRVKAWSSPAHYLQKVLPHLLEMRCVSFSLLLFSLHWLAFNSSGLKVVSVVFLKFILLLTKFNYSQQKLQIVQMLKM